MVTVTAGTWQVANTVWILKAVKLQRLEFKRPENSLFGRNSSVLRFSQCRNRTEQRQFNFINVCERVSSKFISKETDLQFHTSIKDEVIWEAYSIFHGVTWYTQILQGLSTVHSAVHSENLTFIHSVFCLTTGSKPPPKWFLHLLRSRASSFKWEYPLLEKSH